MNISLLCVSPRRFAANRFIIALGSINYANFLKIVCCPDLWPTLYFCTLTRRKKNKINFSTAARKKKLSIFRPEMFFFLVQRHQRVLQLLSLCIFCVFFPFVALMSNISFISTTEKQVFPLSNITT